MRLRRDLASRYPDRLRGCFSDEGWRETGNCSARVNEMGRVERGAEETTLRTVP